MHIYLLYTNTSYDYFLRKTSHFNVYSRMNLKILLPLLRFFKGKYWFLFSVVYFFYCFFLPWPPWKQGIEFLKDLRGKRFLSAGSRKLSERSTVLSAFLLPFLILPWWSEEEKKLYVCMCIYVYMFISPTIIPHPSD